MSRLSDAEIIASVADDLPCGVWVARAPGGEFVYANRLFAEIMGMSGRTDVAVGEYASPYGIHGRDGKLYPESRMPFVLAVQQRTAIIVDDIVIHRADGRKVYIRAQAKPVMDAAGELSHVVIAFIDITREVVAEAARVESDTRLAKSQRLELVGNLAGGIAHDFNNLLATVKTLASTLRLGESDPARIEAFQLIDQASESAVHLTRALLGFAGRGRHHHTRIPLNDVVRGTAELLARTVGANVHVSLDLAATSDTVGDWSQLEQVLMNLGINARDAMPDGGELRFATREVDAVDARLALAPGHYVALEVSDNGSGIDPAIREKVFEPYFTTKTSGLVLGSGLGLATVWGIVESHGGTVEITSAVPHGTRMIVYLPAAPAEARRPTPPPAAARLVRGSGRILVVEDEENLRQATAAALVALGYDPVAAASGEEALELFVPGTFAVTLLDLGLPGIDGATVFERLRQRDPQARVVLTSGFARNEEVQRLLDAGAKSFLPKPYAIEALSEAIA